MTSKREQVLQAVEKALKAAAPDGATVARNQAKPERTPKEGAIYVRDGDPGEPDVIMSPLTYTYFHKIPIEAAVFPDATRSKEAMLDSLITALGDAFAADRTLGGLCEFVEFEAPSIGEIEQQGQLTGLWADFSIICTYSTNNPLN